MDELNAIFSILKAQSVLSRKFDTLSAHGIGLTDYMILHILSVSQGNKVRRIDLAEKAGLTASGITRLLNPLEKIGLVARERNERDARVSYVTITSTGLRVLEDATADATRVAKKLFANVPPRALASFNNQLRLLAGDIEP